MQYKETFSRQDFFTKNEEVYLKLAQNLKDRKDFEQTQKKLRAQSIMDYVQKRININFKDAVLTMHSNYLEAKVQKSIYIIPCYAYNNGKPKIEIKSLLKVVNRKKPFSYQLNGQEGRNVELLCYYVCESNAIDDPLPMPSYTDFVD